MSKQETKSKDKTRRTPPAESKAQAREPAESNPAENVSEQLQPAVTESTAESGAKKAKVLAGAAAKKIEEGVGYVGEKAPEVASIVLHKVKKGATAAYGAGSTFMKGALHRGRDYAEKTKHKVEIRKLQAKRDALISKLGSIIYTGIAVDKEAPDKLLTSGEIQSLVEKIGELENDLLTAGQALEKH